MAERTAARAELNRLRHQVTASAEYARVKDYRSAWHGLSAAVERYLAVAATPEQDTLGRIADCLERFERRMFSA